MSLNNLKKGKLMDTIERHGINGHHRINYVVDSMDTLSEITYTNINSYGEYDKY